MSSRQRTRNWAGFTIVAGPRFPSHLLHKLADEIRDSRLEQPGELFGNRWPAEIISLRLVTLLRLKKGQLLASLDPLRHHPQLQTAAHPDAPGDDRRFRGHGSDLAHERLVDLKPVYR